MSETMVSCKLLQISHNDFQGIWPIYKQWWISLDPALGKDLGPEIQKKKKKKPHSPVSKTKI